VALRWSTDGKVIAHRHAGKRHPPTSARMAQAPTCDAGYQAKVKSLSVDGERGFSTPRPAGVTA